MTKELVTLDASPSFLANQSSVPQGLAITHDVRLRQAQAEMLSRMQMALVMPRQWLDVSTKLLSACDNPDFAREAYYSKPAGRDKIEGLSIRFAELALRLMRNISVDCAPEMEDELSAHYRLVVTDLESNTPMAETFKVDKTVERRGVKDTDTVLSRRTNAQGETVYLIPSTEDQFTTKLRAQMARVRRTLLLAMVPAEVKAQCLEKCKRVANDADAKDPAGPAKTIVGAFLSIGVDVSDLKDYLGKSPTAATPKEIEDLRGVYSLLRDGEVTWTDIMDAKRERAAAQGGSKAELIDKKRKDKAKARAAAQPAAAATPKPRGRGAAKPPETPAAGGAGATTTPAATDAPKPPRASRRDEDDDDDGDDDAPDSSPPSSQP